MSCRRGVKDGDCGCCKSLAAKVRELYQRCANAIKSINGINPNGANNFDILPGAGIQVNPRANGIEIVATGASPEGLVESVNGILPDEDGDVQINTGLLTVNGEAPDEDGEFSISAGSGIQINAGTNGIEIENTSQGAIYTATAPIQIDADNDISLMDWVQVPNTDDWSQFITNGKTNTDLWLAMNVQINNSRVRQNVFIPAGFPTDRGIVYYVVPESTNNTGIGLGSIGIQGFLTKISNTFYMQKYNLTGSGIYENVDIGVNAVAITAANYTLFVRRS